MTELRPMGCAEIEDLAGLYVLGALDDDETAAVSAHIATCPDAHETFADLAATVSSLPLAVDPRDAPAGTRERVMASVAATPQAGPADVASTAVAPEPPPRTMPPTVADPSRRPSLLERLRGGRDDSAWLGLAAAIGAIALIAVGLLGTLQLASDENERLELFRRAAVAAQDPARTVAVLAGTDGAAGAAGFAVFGPDDEAYIVIDGLGPTTEGNVYQAWFVGEGDPVSAGLLDRSDDGLALLTGLAVPDDVAVVAVTIEASPGAEQPTSTPIIVGEVRATA